MDARLTRINQAAEYLMTRLEGFRPTVGIVLGSGLGKLADHIEDPVVIPYKDVPEFPVSTAIGHKGNFLVGEIGGKMADLSVVTADNSRFEKVEDIIADAYYNMMVKAQRAQVLPTGQLKWPIPVFGGLGLLLAGYGVLTLLKKRKDEET